MIQDRRGFMWFGTEDGLNRYDGYGFFVIRNDPDNPSSLSHNDVTTLYEDHSGIIWMGTNNGGLNRYDPATETFTRYQFDPGNPRSISNDFITALSEDNEGNLWIGTLAGLNRFVPAGKNNEDTASFVRYIRDPNNSWTLSGNVIRTIYVDQSGALWVGTEGGLNKGVRIVPGNHSIDSLLFIRIHSNPNDPASLTDDRIRSLYEDSRGTLWVGTERGLNKLIANPTLSGGRTRARFVRYFNSPSNPRSLSHNGVYALFEDKSGTFWVGTNGGGIDRFNRDNGQFIRYENDPRDPTSLSYNQIRCIYEDRSGNLWIGTYGGGISKVDRGKKAFEHFTRDPESNNTLSEPIVWCVYEDEEGILWIGTHGGGLNRLDRKTGRYTQYRANPLNPRSLPSDFIRCVVEDRSGYLWLGTSASGIARFNRKTGGCVTYQNDPSNPSSLSNNAIRALYIDASDTLWIGTLGGGLNKMAPPKQKEESPTFVRYVNDPSDPRSLGNNFIRAIYEDKAGTFWLPTYGGGIDSFDPRTGVFEHFRNDRNVPGSLSNNYVFAVTEDREGILWIGTWGGGLNRYDRKAGVFTSFRQNDGLPSDAIYGILEDREGFLWFSSNKGLSKCDPRKETFRNFDVNDGLQSNEFNGGSYFKSKTGEMFFGGINGFNAFMPETIKDNPYVPPIVITSFRKMNQEVKFGRSIADVRTLELSYKDYVFSFEFAALDYTNPDKNRYAYKMEGLDKEWVFTNSHKRFAHYTTLPPGGYVFRVKGSNNDGIWNNEGVSVRVVITPPFWRTLWFGTLVVLFVSGVGLASYSRRMKNVRMKAELRTAHDAQMSIMPQEDPKIAGIELSGICVPANEVGGDFFDYLWCNDGGNRVGVIVGDVSGKAMKAAMTAVMTSGMIRSEATEQQTVSGILTRVNKPLFEKTHKEIFVAACLASLSLKGKELVFANAGLTKPVLKSRGTVAFLEAKGATHPLGVFEGCTYREAKKKLGTGDVVVFCTDGIQEAQNRMREFYGDERLIRLLSRIDTSVHSARAIKDQIVQDVQAFVGSAPQHDDMTVVVLKVVK